MSRILLKDERIMNIVIKSLVGEHVSSSMYTSGRCEWVNKTVSEVVYLPKIQDVAPILIEIQYKVDEDFINRAIKHCLSMKEECGVLPLMLIISIKGFSNEAIKTKLINIDNHYLDDISCDFWAEKCGILSSKSMENHLSETPLNQLVALGHFLSQQKKCILSIDKKHDPTIQLLYQISKEKFENECQVEEEKLDVIKDLCFKGKRQFQKILSCVEKGDSIDMIEKYAKDGEDFFYRQEKKINGQQLRQVTSIQDTPDITNLSLPQRNNTTDKNDFDYIEHYKANNSGRMKWETCYIHGKNEGFFNNYSSSKTLKSTYHNKKTKLRKRTITEIGE
jgi:hypothetical protein